MDDSVPQFDGAGPRVIVKNTFLDFEEALEALAPPPLERVRTVPSNFCYSSAGVDDDDKEVRRKSAPAAADGEEPIDEEEEDEDAPLTGDEAEEQPTGLKLTRCTTREWYEPAQDWDWASGQAAPSQPSPEAFMPPAGSPTSGPPMAVAGPAPVMYQGMPMPPGATTVMVPMLLPVGAAMGAGYSPNTSLPVMTGPPGAAPSTPIAGTNPSMSSPSMGGASPSGGGAGKWPPPPPELAPTIERVSSGGMAPPMISPDAGKLHNLMAQMEAYDPSDGADASKEGTQAASGAAPAAPAEPAKSPTASAPQPQTLMRAFSISSGYFRIHWTVDARKLKGNDKQAVSPPFELSFGGENVIFKMMIYPKAMNDSKGGASFKKAKGRGYVQLKCEAEIAEGVAQIRFRIGIGEGESAQGPRGPQLHNFSQSAVCGLSKDQEEWNFEDVVDKDSQTFRVTLEIVPAAGAC